MTQQFPGLSHDPRYPLSHVRVIDEPSGEDASKVIKDLEAREEAFAERERIKKALGTPEE